MLSSVLCFRAATLIGTLGMIWGLAMAISGNHTTFSAHAHLNLLGWVSLFLIGLFYRLHPALDAAGKAKGQALIWIASTLIMAAGVALIYGGNPALGEPLAGIGGIGMLLAMLFFVWIVWRQKAA